ncbi:MAG: hypothetical protein ACFFE5_08150 [Candidatus Thorarchaeota archaeon]
MTENITNDNSTQEIVVIKKEAFRNMVTHVLRFGSNVLEKSKEVMGICLGNFKATDRKIFIENAIPVMHGTAVSVGFSKNEIELIEQIENQYKKSLVGWYISRPGWGLDFTDITISNHQHFQNEKFPQGICIIFDHTLMGLGGDFGFEIFRLDDYTIKDKFSNVPYEIEVPSTLEYFKWIQKFMEDFQKKDPILIKEVNEIVETIPGDLQEIPIPETKEPIEEEREKFLELDSIISGFKQGSEKFSDVFMNTFQYQFGNWINDLERGSSRGTEYIANAIEKMKQAVVSGLLKVSGWFKKTMNEKVYDFKNKVSNYIDSRIEVQRQIAEDMNGSKENLIDNLKNLIGNKIKHIESEIEDSANSTKNKLEEVSQTYIKIEEMIERLNDHLNSINNQTKIFSQEIENKIEISINPLQSILNEKVEKLSGELDPFKENYSEIRILLDKLQKIITEFRNLT